MQDNSVPPLAATLDFPLALIEGFRNSYAPDIVWTAPRRNVHWIGRDAVVANLLREAAAMQGLTFTRLRRSTAEGQVIDEFVARFVYRAGERIENVELPAGAAIELERVRILTLDPQQRVFRENVIETWTVLDAASGKSPRRERVTP